MGDPIKGPSRSVEAGSVIWEKMVGMGGVEPPRSYERQILNLLRLPIPSHPLNPNQAEPWSVPRGVVALTHTLGRHDVQALPTRLG